jgi:RNA-directed DNA polymerase
MKRVGGVYDAIWQWDNLRTAFWNARKGAARSGAVARFEAKLDDHLRELASDIRQERVQSAGSTQFVIHDPKERTITAPAFRDRVLHHAIMNVCEPHFDRWLIFDSYACRKGKGRLAALQRATHYAKAHGWFLKLDIRQYFASIPQERLLGELRRKFKDVRLLGLLERLICTESGLGLPIGSLLSQHLANFYLGPVDRLCREQLQLPGYVRYMDDFTLWADDSVALRQAWRQVEDCVQGQLGLEIKAGAHLNRTAHGMNFCGFRLYPGWRVLNRRSCLRLAARLDELSLVNSERAQQSRGEAVIAFAKEGQTWHQRRRALARVPTA